jgi:hypothetical protein
MGYLVCRMPDSPRLRLVFALLCLLGCTLPASAQIATSLRLARKMHLAGEPVMAVVTVTNHAGRTLVFQSDGRVPWLSFTVKNSNGSNAQSRTSSLFGPMKIEAGQTLAREVNLSEHFHLSDPGNFSVFASIREPQEGMVFSNTNKIFFTLSTGRTHWSQKVGISGGAREYRLVQFTDDSKSHLYTQILDSAGRRPLHTLRLGEALMLRRPLVTVDRNQNMHVMFLGTPTMWVHCIVDTNGRMLGRQIHQRGPVGDPQLVTAGDGSVRVANSIPYDPKAAAQEKAKIRKATDRPNITY